MEEAYKKLSCRVFCLTMSVLLIFSLAMAASAVASFVLAGSYGKLRGTGVASTVQNVVDTTATIANNPDNALLYVTFSTADGVSNSSAVVTHESQRNVTEYSTDFQYDIDGSWTPTKAYITYGVKGGSVEEAYALYTTITLPDIN